MFKKLKKLLPAPARAQSFAQANLVANEFPDALYAIGDVHGCLDQLKDLESKILSDFSEAHGDNPHARCLIVLVGDYVDRGPKSAEVLDHLMAPLRNGVQRLCLKGNHEEMFEHFLGQLDVNDDWLGFGGRETLSSYGVSQNPDDWLGLSQRRLTSKIEASIPRNHHDFLKGLPVSLQIGPYLLSHAGYDPTAALEKQTIQTMLWGDPSKFDFGEDDLISVHGHIVVPEPQRVGNRINIDTGACFGGGLTAACLRKDGSARFLSVL